MKDLHRHPLFFIHAVAGPLIALFGGILFSPAVAAILLMSWGVLFYTSFWFIGQDRRPAPTADLVSGSRLLIAYFYLALAATGRIGPWTAILLAAIIEIVDGIDGLIARREGPTPFGGVWDMELDAYVILILSFAAVEFASMPRWVLAIGGMRYIGFFAFLFWKPEGATFSRDLSNFSKTVCVLTVVFLSVVWLYPALFMRRLLFLSLILLASSFVWEGVSYAAVLHRRTQTRKR